MSYATSSLPLLGGRLSVDFVNATPQNTELSWERLIRLLNSTDIIAEGARARLRLCANAHCGLFFYDNSRTRRRRWCSMAVCGNRSKVAAFARKRASARSAP